MKELYQVEGNALNHYNHNTKDYHKNILFLPKGNQYLYLLNYLHQELNYNLYNIYFQIKKEN